jgi:hypothetical protein
METVKEGITRYYDKNGNEIAVQAASEPEEYVVRELTIVDDGDGDHIPDEEAQA